MTEAKRLSRDVLSLFTWQATAENYPEVKVGKEVGLDTGWWAFISFSGRGTLWTRGQPTPTAALADLWRRLQEDQP